MVQQFAGLEIKEKKGKETREQQMSSETREVAYTTSVYKLGNKCPLL